MRAALADAGVERRADRLRQRARHLDAAQRPRRDARHQARARRARAARSRSPRPSPRSGTCSAPPAPSRPSRRCSRCATASRRRRSACTSPTPSSTSTTSPGARSRGRWQARRPSGAPARAVQLVRLRRPQRRALPGGRMSARRCCAARPTSASTPLERLEVLCDPGSLQLLRTQVRSRRMGERARAGDGVLAAHARVDGRQVFCYAQDASFAGGSLGEAHARDDRRGAAARRPRARAGDRLHRVRRRAHAGGARRALRLRRDLPRARAPVGRRAADLDRLRAVGRRLLLRPGAHRLRDHDRARERCS